MKKSRNARDYSIKEFMEMELPENSRLIENKLGDKYIGPFSKRLRRISVSYNVEFTDLEPVFRKLDLILASGDKALVESALKINTITIENLIKNKPAVRLIASIDHLNSKDGYLLSNDNEWESWPHEAERINDGNVESVASEARVSDSGDSGHAVFSECHPKVAEFHNIWIPEFENIFENLDKMIVATV